MTSRRRVLRAGPPSRGPGWRGASGTRGRRGPGGDAGGRGASDAVYYPSHAEGMEMAGTGSDGPCRVALSYSSPHRFWLVTGRQRELVATREADTVNLMATVSDSESSTVLPAGDVTVEASKGGESAFQRSTCPMLSQAMGLHSGDDVALAGTEPTRCASTSRPRAPD